MILYYVLKDQEIYERLIQEIGESNKPITWDDIKNLPYLEAVINETLRVYGPAIAIMAREAIDDHKLGFLHIRKGIKLILLII